MLFGVKKLLAILEVRCLSLCVLVMNVLKATENVGIIYRFKAYSSISSKYGYTGRHLVCDFLYCT